MVNIHHIFIPIKRRFSASTESNQNKNPTTSASPRWEANLSPTLPKSSRFSHSTSLNLPQPKYPALDLNLTIQRRSNLLENPNRNHWENLMNHPPRSSELRRHPQTIDLKPEQQQPPHRPNPTPIDDDRDFNPLCGRLTMFGAHSEIMEKASTLWKMCAGRPGRRRKPFRKLSGLRWIDINCHLHPTLYGYPHFAQTYSLLKTHHRVKLPHKPKKPFMLSCLTKSQLMPLEVRSTSTPTYSDFPRGGKLKPRHRWDTSYLPIRIFGCRKWLIFKTEENGPLKSTYWGQGSRYLHGIFAV